MRARGRGVRRSSTLPARARAQCQKRMQSRSGCRARDGLRACRAGRSLRAAVRASGAIGVKPAMVFSPDIHSRRDRDALSGGGRDALLGADRQREQRAAVQRAHTSRVWGFWAGEPVRQRWPLACARFCGRKGRGFALEALPFGRSGGTDGVIDKVLGLVLFIGVHSFTMMRERTRGGDREAWVLNGYKGVLFGSGTARFRSLKS